jgi:hypothetical protein
MLDAALIGADAHKKALGEKRKSKFRFSRHLEFLPRWLTVTVVVLIVTSVGTYFAWQNIPQVSMKLASVRAEVEGSLPAYVPSGFKFTGPVKYNDGKVSMTFTGEGNRTFTLEQQATSLDSSSIKENATANESRMHTSQVKGSTVYYDSAKNEAVWVVGDKLNKLKGPLTPEEVNKIAGSLL